MNVWVIPSRLFTQIGKVWLMRSPALMKRRCGWLIGDDTSGLFNLFPILKTISKKGDDILL
jgi:hypothetical protein